jgi:uncharacterized protein (DUF849 family)
VVVRPGSRAAWRTPHGGRAEIVSLRLMLLQAALNGPFTKADHPAVPVMIDEVVADAAACLKVGAGAFHLHPRNRAGAESLHAEVVDSVVGAVRARCGVPVGVSTGAWIEPDPDRRVRLVAAWRGPDFASVNVSEPGAVEIMRALLDADIGIEVGVFSVQDAERLAASGLASRVSRVLVEPVEVSADDALQVVDEIHAALDWARVCAPRLEHGDGEATWVLIEDAVRRGLATRVGLEDTTHGPDGQLAADNAALIRAARELGAGSTSATHSR